MKGFRLKWTSELVDPPAWHSFSEVTDWAKDYIHKKVNSMEFKPGKRSGVKDKVDNYFRQ